MSLPPKHAAFAREFVVDLNATQAAIRAGYSKKTARQQGSRLLSNADICAEIDRLKTQIQSKALVTAEEVLKELRRVAFSDPAKVLGENGYLLTMNEMPEDVRRSIAGIDLDGSGGTKIKFWNKPQALELLGKHLAMWTDKTEITGKNGGPVDLIINGVVPE